MKTRPDSLRDLPALELCFHYHMSLAADALQRMIQIRKRRRERALFQALLIRSLSHQLSTINPKRN